MTNWNKLAVAEFNVLKGSAVVEQLVLVTRQYAKGKQGLKGVT